MPSQEVIDRHRDALVGYARAIERLVPSLGEIARASVRDLFPEASDVEVQGAFDEDGVVTLRVHRVLDDGGRVLYDADVGPSDNAVADELEDVGVEYLDLLATLTGDRYLGRHLLER